MQELSPIHSVLPNKTSKDQSFEGLYTVILAKKFLGRLGVPSSVGKSLVNKKYSVRSGFPVIRQESQEYEGKASHWRTSRRMHNRRFGTIHVPMVPISVKAPVLESILYMETLFELEFVT
jgi:hypothetical protein